MTITEEQKAKLLDAYRAAYIMKRNLIDDWEDGRAFGEEEGLEQALEIIGLSAEAEQIREEMKG